eukprot:CAMPEP_0113391572 /NCGR_PEP_ID=MMETSP0013_2-20120614/10793_1 /TAXON_ID=2843 ORGANISM="Skeletonema costatum, Strain 1716" /NCGR_SAMPLE_ID=MMETSP0013_2 /ASSEMBLY_ACC=CAM_ASM_000158 /LENGTH=376 /DNA_ID=CAMNT_0000274847 /DNA_START=108 /DNA_END=1237 /DNA_ORIENTATION=+ /assembly_acc=CAM_ASM_000158
MKLAIATLLVGSAAAFAPAATPMRNSALSMSTETTTEKAFAKLPASVKPGVVRRSAPQGGEEAIDPWKPGLLAVISVKHNRNSVKSGNFVHVLGTSDVPAIEAWSASLLTDFPAMTVQASIAGTIAGAKHVHEVAALYGVPVVLHTDHCQKAWLPWIDGLLTASEEHFAATGSPLFSSHMLDLSEEPLEENIGICKDYLEKFAKVGILLEFELGVTGGEEDGVDNTDIDSSRLYTQPEEVFYAYEQLSQVENGAFTCAASFGNVHGVYAPGNVDLQPKILMNSQAYIKEKIGSDSDKPMKFVFHGGSGSDVSDIQEAIGYGVIKMNIDTDTQWAFWDGVRAYEAKYHDYLQGQIGNPEGDDKPNKKYYDPRMSLRA